MNRLTYMLLRELFKSSSGLEPFTLFHRLRIGFSSLLSEIQKAHKLGYIKPVEGSEKWLLTECGVKELQLASKNKVDQPWKQTPGRFLDKKTNIQEYYIPKRSLLDRKTFNVRENELD